MKSGNEGIFNDEGKSDVIEEAESRKEGINQCYANVHWVVKVLKVKNMI